ncbi:MAG: MlaD family protein [Fibrobacterota bacterium]
MSKTTEHHNQDPFYYRYRTHIVGLFVLIPLLIISATLIQFLISSEFFTPQSDIFLRIDHGIPLERGNSVTIMEQKVGYIKNMNLNKDGYLDIQMSIEDQYMEMVRNDSKCMIKQKQTVVGDWLIDIRPSSTKAAAIRHGDTLTSYEFIRIEEMVHRLTTMSRSAHSILNQIAYGEGVMSTLISDEELSEELLYFLAQAVSLVENMNLSIDEIPQILEDVPPFLTDLQQAIRSLDRLGREGVTMAHNLDTFALKAQNVVDSMEKVTAKVEELTDSTAAIPPVMKESFMEIDSSVIHLKAILNGMREHWFFKRSIRRAEEQNE